MKILILGGSGAIGAHLSQILLKQGHHVTITTRKKNASLQFQQQLIGNAKDISFLRDALASKWDAVVDFMNYSTTEFSDRMRPLLLSTGHYVFLSSSRVYAESNQPIKESDARILDTCKANNYLKTDEYALAKARQEDLLETTNRSNWTIIRPYITYSEQRLQLTVFEKEHWLHRHLNGRSVPLCGEILSKKTTLTHARDVADGIAKLLFKSNTLGEAYHITNNTATTWKNVTQIYSNILTSLHYNALSTKCVKLKDFYNFHNAHEQILYDRLYNRTFDNTKVSKFIDIRNFSSVEDGLFECLEKFLQQGTFRHIDWRLEAKKDRHTKEKANIFREIHQPKDMFRYLKHRYL